MSRKKAKGEFSVMEAFLAALPQMDDNAIRAAVNWMQAKGEAEIKRRQESTDKPEAAQ
jgi:hypothetical protein